MKAQKKGLYLSLKDLEIKKKGGGLVGPVLNVSSELGIWKTKMVLVLGRKNSIGNDYSEIRNSAVGE